MSISSSEFPWIRFGSNIRKCTSKIESGPCSYGRVGNCDQPPGKGVTSPLWHNMIEWYHGSCKSSIFSIVNIYTPRKESGKTSWFLPEKKHINGLSWIIHNHPNTNRWFSRETKKQQFPGKSLPRLPQLYPHLRLPSTAGEPFTKPS